MAPNPSPLTGPGTNTYLVGGTGMVIVDPGPNDPTHLENIVAALSILQAAAQAIILTHHHPDHRAGAEDLARRLAVPVLSFNAPLHHADEIKLSPCTLPPLIALHTPGHTHDHLCLWLAESRLLLAGDLVAGQGTVLVVPPDGNMAAYLDSLRAMLALAPVAILPGHGPVIEQPTTLLQHYLGHRLKREQQVLNWLNQGYTTAAAIAAGIYADQPVDLDIATLQVEAHLIKLRCEGRG